MSSAAVLSDTPTPTSARNGTGVDGDNAADADGSKVNALAPSKIGGEIEYTAHFVSNQSIKDEPPEDITDVHNSNSDDDDDCDGGNGENIVKNLADGITGYNNNSNSREGAGSGSGTESPTIQKIRLTPTNKLLAVLPNPIDPKRKFICPYENCTKSYGKSSHLRSHLTWHTGIKPFVCQEPHCGKGFTRSDELNRHVRTHTGEKPFECSQCWKKFSRSDHLTKHLATHAKQMQNNALKRTHTQMTRQRQINQFEQAFPRAISSSISNANDVEAPQRVCDEREKILAKHAQQMQNMVKRKRETILGIEHGVKRSPAAKKKKKKGRVGDDENDEDPIGTGGSGHSGQVDHMTFSEGMHFMAALVHNPDEEPENLVNANDATVPVPSTASSLVPIKIKLGRPDSHNPYHVVRPKKGKGKAARTATTTTTTTTAAAAAMAALESINNGANSNSSNSGSGSGSASPPPQQPIKRSISDSEDDDDDLLTEMIVPVSTMICPSSPDNNNKFVTYTDDNGMLNKSNGNSSRTPKAATVRSGSGSSAATGGGGGGGGGGGIATADRPFTCGDCDKSFKRQDDLNRHVRTHTGEKPFACNQCDRRFMRSDHLKKHMKTHSKMR